MNIQAKKIHLIEEFLKLKNDTILDELETVIKKAKRKTKSASTIYDFVGIWNKKEAEQIKKAVAETCEKINEDDWK
jgi:hypothetical protein